MYSRYKVTIVKLITLPYTQSNMATCHYGSFTTSISLQYGLMLNHSIWKQGGGGGEGLTQFKKLYFYSKIINKLTKCVSIFHFWQVF